MDEVFSKYLIPQMFAQVSQGKMSAADSVRSINTQVKEIYAKWKAARKDLRAARRRSDAVRRQTRHDDLRAARALGLTRPRVGHALRASKRSTAISIRPATAWSSSSR